MSRRRHRCAPRNTRSDLWPARARGTENNSRWTQRGGDRAMQARTRVKHIVAFFIFPCLSFFCLHPAYIASINPPPPPPPKFSPHATRYYFGEAALMGDTTTTASISCVTNSVLLILNRKTLLELTGSYFVSSPTPSPCPLVLSLSSLCVVLSRATKSLTSDPGPLLVMTLNAYVSY
jgi:hypothetical protein